jgi:hypothetical protein
LSAQGQPTSHLPYPRAPGPPLRPQPDSGEPGRGVDDLRTAGAASESTPAAPKLTDLEARPSPDRAPASPLREPALGPGSVLGSYRLVRLIGSGGIGAVYEAAHVQLGKQVAVKGPVARAHGACGSTSALPADLDVALDSQPIAASTRPRLEKLVVVSSMIENVTTGCRLGKTAVANEGEAPFFPGTRRIRDHADRSVLARAPVARLVPRRNAIFRCDNSRRPASEGATPPAVGRSSTGRCGPKPLVHRRAR